jgi:hypothetical protein
MARDALAFSRAYGGGYIPRGGRARRSSEGGMQSAIRRGAPVRSQGKQCPRPARPLRGRAEPRVRESDGGGRLPRRLPGAGDRAVASTDDLQESAAYASRDVREGGQRLPYSRASLNSGCLKTGERLYALGPPGPKAARCPRQRFPTLRTPQRLGNYEEKAKIGYFSTCLSTALCKCPMVAGDWRQRAVGIGCITAGKSVPLLQEWCGLRRTLL